MKFFPANVLCRIAAGLLLAAGGRAVSAQAAGTAADPPSPPAVEHGLSALRGRLAGLAAEYRRATDGGSLPRASGSTDEARIALASLQVEKGLDWLRLSAEWSSQAGTCLRDAEAILASDWSGGLLPMVRHGQLTEYAYFARNDGSPQPYFLYDPSRYSDDGRELHPLVIFLHGYVPDTSRINPYLVPEFVLAMCEERQALLAIPHGRTNTDFQYAGEVDVLRVLAEVKKFRRVDPARVYLIGVSMGGAGVWHLATHYPDLFAAVAPINAQGDWFKFWQDQFGYPPRAGLPRHVQYLFAANNPLDLAENLSNLYSYSQHASLCFVGAAHTRAMVAALRAAGAPHDFFEDPSELGHYIYWQPDCWRRAFEHLFRHRSEPLPPRGIRYATYSLRFPGAYWCRIGKIARWGRVARFAATVSEQGVVTLATENVSELTLDLPGAWLRSDKTVEVIWNGEEVGAMSPAPDGTLRLAMPQAAGHETGAAPGPAKNRSVCGPAGDLFNFPFLIVQGTAGDAEARQRNKTLAQALAGDWFNYAEGMATLVADTELTPAQMADHGLVLVGFPDENTVASRIADSLPFAFSEKSITLSPDRVYQRQRRGFFLTCPNPLQPQRYLLLYGGIPWGEGRSRNHKFDCMPDFAVYERAIVQPVGYNRFLAAGLLDENWRFAEELTDFFPPANPPGETEPQADAAGSR